MNPDHKCKKCEKSEPEIRFLWRTTKTGRYRRHLCTGCYNDYRKQFPNRSKAAASARYHKKVTKWRASNQYTERWILQDSRHADKKNGLANDLDEAFIREKIKTGCAYCGETRLRMTLDRVNNAVGHTKANVVPACVRCNSIRMSMPFQAWLIVAKAVRKIRLAGLFGTWTGRKYIQSGEIRTRGPEPRALAN